MSRVEDLKIWITRFLIHCAQKHLAVPEVKRRLPSELEPFAKQVYSRLTRLQQFKVPTERATAAFYIACALESVQFASAAEKYSRLLGWQAEHELEGEDGKCVKDDTDGKIFEKIIKREDRWLMPITMAPNCPPPWRLD